jgi:uncharacterized protein
MLIRVLLLLAVVFAVVWLVRGGRRRGALRDAPPPPVPAQEEMVACSHCGLHLPRGEALPAAGGHFCSEAHRAAFEQAQR